MSTLEHEQALAEAIAPQKPCGEAALLCVLLLYVQEQLVKVLQTMTIHSGVHTQATHTQHHSVAFHKAAARTQRTQDRVR
jgi:hypothetical protein